jgi:hypothetical protein
MTGMTQQNKDELKALSKSLDERTHIVAAMADVKTGETMVCIGASLSSSCTLVESLLNSALVQVHEKTGITGLMKVADKIIDDLETTIEQISNGTFKDGD